MGTFIVEEGGHYVFDGDVQPPYEHIESLGHGSGGAVDKVRDINTGLVYARKTIYLRGSSEAKSRIKAAFDNEMQIIRGLGNHRHIVRVFATYSQKSKLGLILDPCADAGDLGRFMDNFRDYSHTYDPQTYEGAVAVLRQAFGCLASALAFMHRRKIRHKDIKPVNILVHQGAVIYTDFGISRDFSHVENSTTTGPEVFMTRRYSAPEVVALESRNSRSDVFSLGCVFFEILSTMANLLVVPSEILYSDFLHAIKDQVGKKSALSARYPKIAANILAMLSFEKELRPSSQEVEEEIRSCPGYICHECRTYNSENPQARFPPQSEPMQQYTAPRSGSSETVGSSRVSYLERHDYLPGPPPPPPPTRYSQGRAIGPGPPPPPPSASFLRGHIIMPNPPPPPPPGYRQ